MATKDMKTLLSDAGYTQIHDAGTAALTSRSESVVMGLVAPSKPYVRPSEHFSDQNVPTETVLKGLQEHQIFSAEVDGALKLFYPSEDVRLTGFDETRVQRDQEGLVILEAGASQTDDLLQVIDVNGKLIAWRRDTGEVFWGTAEHVSSTRHKIDVSDEGAADFSLSADDFVAEAEDPWLYDLLAIEFSTNQRARMRWALRAFMRYRRVSQTDLESLDITKDFAFDPSVKRAMRLVDDLLEKDRDVAPRAARTEAENLREDIEQAYGEALEGAELSRSDWQSLCIQREELAVEMHTLPADERSNAVYDIIKDLDETAELLLLEAASHHRIDDPLLSRALETGDATWWIRENEEWP